MNNKLQLGRDEDAGLFAMTYPLIMPPYNNIVCINIDTMFKIYTEFMNSDYVNDESFQNYISKEYGIKDLRFLSIDELGERMYSYEIVDERLFTLYALKWR